MLIMRSSLSQPLVMPMSELSPAFPEGDARNAIMSAALEVFAAHGFHGAGTRAIAVQAGVSQPLLNHHFGGKEGLWRAVGERITSDFIAFMSEVVDPTQHSDAGMTAMLRGYLQFWMKRPKAFRFNRWRRLDGLADERIARSNQMTRYGVAFIQKAQAEGVVRNDLPPGLALVIGGGLIQFWLESQIEVRDALSVTDDAELSDEGFIAHLTSLLRGD
jgi:TetR/AcrR family transcriptional regulator